jgi:predicted RNA binding protein YcfA (HicA-like mRNA interferase family)
MLTQDGWYPASQKGSHIKMRHKVKSGTIIFPNHGSNEVGTGLEKKLLKQAGLRK